jgi:hypothetical protein
MEHQECNGSSDSRCQGHTPTQRHAAYDQLRHSATERRWPQAHGLAVALDARNRRGEDARVVDPLHRQCAVIGRGRGRGEDVRALHRERQREVVDVLGHRISPLRSALARNWPPARAAGLVRPEAWGQIVVACAGREDVSLTAVWM